MLIGREMGVQNHENAMTKSLVFIGSVAATQNNAVQQKGKQRTRYAIVEIMAQALALP